MGLTVAAVVTALASAGFGVVGAVHVWRGTMREDPEEPGTFTLPPRDTKTLALLLLTPSFAALSAALSLAAVLSS